MTKKAKATTKVTKKQVGIAHEDVSQLQGKSAKVRYYLSKGYGRKEIAEQLGILYQHVRNVEVTLLKKDMK